MRQGQKMSLYANFFPIRFSSDQLNISRIDYSVESLLNLRKVYNKTHSFFRNGDYIYISPMTDANQQIGEYVSLSIRENLSIVSSLIKHIFFRTFRNQFPNILPLSFYPFQFLSRKDNDDLLFGLLGDDLKGILSNRKQIELQFRTIEKDDQSRLGLLININHQWIFSKNCQELTQEGFNIIGSNIFIYEPIPGLDGIIAPDESFIGSVSSVNHDKALIDTNSGIKEIELSKIFLQKNTHNIRDYLDFKVGEEKSDKIFNALKIEIDRRLNIGYYYAEISEIAKTIASLEYKNSDGFSFAIKPTPFLVENSYNIQPIRYIFDYSPGRSDSNPSRGLNNYGPYDSNTFDIKTVKVLVVCNKKNRGAFTEFCGKIKDGIPSSSVFRNGMLGKYRLHNIMFDIIEIEDYSVGSYLSKITDYVTNQSSLPHLAIVETRDEFHSKPVVENPYFNVKAYLLNIGIPVQFIKNEKIRLPDISLQWIVESVALQIYAKLGGKPWVLPASSSIDYELIIGIGSTILRDNQMVGNQKKRIVGITTFFTGDGRYIYSNRSKDVDYEDYFNELLKSLQQSIKDISQDYGWQDRSTVRITFHIFKPIKNIEVDVVDELISSFSQYQIKYCFVTISEANPFVMFSKDDDKNNKATNLIQIPERYSNWIIDSKSCLIQLCGKNELKVKKHNFSHPILVKIHDKSTFTDLNTVVQQIFNFTNLSWRGFNPSLTPVTILYSELIASQLAKLKLIGNWKPELVNSQLRSKKWFL